jgi:hypothetical protein
MPTFAYTFSPGTLTQSDGILSTAVPLEGTVEGFGPVWGTFHSHNVGKPSGTYEFIGVSFPDSGESVTGVGSGEWTQVAPGRWTTVGSSELSTGQTIKAEGVISLTERTWTGTFG